MGFRAFTAHLSLGVCAALLWACAGGAPRGDYQVPLAEKQIGEMEKKIDELHHRVSMMQFMIDNHERSIINLEKASTEKKEPGASALDAPPGPGSLVSKAVPDKEIQPPAAPGIHPDSPDVPNEDLSRHPEMLYNSALAAYKIMDYNTAVSEFTAFAEKYPEHELADNALYWVGECLYGQKKFSKAVAAFEAVTTRYPEGSKVPDALLKTGYAYLALDDKDNALLFLEKVIRNFPFSQAGSKAEGMLKRLD